MERETYAAVRQASTRPEVEPRAAKRGAGQVPLAARPVGGQPHRGRPVGELHLTAVVRPGEQVDVACLAAERALSD